MQIRYVKLTENKSYKWVYYGDDGQMHYGFQIADSVQPYFDPVTSACDNIGYQNPAGYFEVSTRAVDISHLGQGEGVCILMPSMISLLQQGGNCIAVKLSAIQPEGM